MNIRTEHLADGNIFISRSMLTDEIAMKEGYKFIGVAKDYDDSECYIWEIMSLELYREYK